MAGAAVGPRFVRPFWPGLRVGLPADDPLESAAFAPAVLRPALFPAVLFPAVALPLTVFLASFFLLAGLAASVDDVLDGGVARLWTVRFRTLRAVHGRCRAGGSRFAGGGAHAEISGGVMNPVLAVGGSPRGDGIARIWTDSRAGEPECYSQWERLNGNFRKS